MAEDHARRCISIHALREEGDAAGQLAIPPDILFLSTPSARRATRTAIGYRLKGIISIHALREEGDRSSSSPFSRMAKFLSTPSARRATIRKGAAGMDIVISIHALREEGDTGVQADRMGDSDFYPRPPRGGRRKRFLDDAEELKFLSTPSARRATSGEITRGLRSYDFYPRPPRGGRPGGLLP